MNRPQQSSQGVPTMPTKQEPAPRWSDEELSMAKDFEIFIAQEKTEGSESYIQKAGRLSNSFAVAHLKKYQSLGSLSIHSYRDLPDGVRSALSHLAAEAKKKKELHNSEYRNTLLKKRIQTESDGLSSEMLAAEQAGNVRYLIEHADPDKLDDMLNNLASESI